jgi:hypothetical protein
MALLPLFPLAAAHRYCAGFAITIAQKSFAGGNVFRGCGAAKVALRASENLGLKGRPLISAGQSSKRVTATEGSSRLAKSSVLLCSENFLPIPISQVCRLEPNERSGSCRQQEIATAKQKLSTALIKDHAGLDC